MFDGLGTTIGQGIINAFGALIYANLAAIGIFFGIVILLFFAVRELMTWYFKIDKVIKLLEKIEENTRK